VAKNTQKCPSLRISRFFFLSKCEQLRKKTQVYWIHALCLVRAEQFTYHIFCAQVLYFKCGWAASMVIIEYFSYIHTTGQYKRLSLARRSFIIRKSDFGRAGSRQMFLVPTQIKPWVARYTDVTVLYVPLRFRGHSSIRFRYNRGKKSTMLGFFSFILNRQ